MIARPALDAVVSALDGVNDVREATEILQTRGLWPREDAPPINSVDTLAAVAALGVETIATVSALLREAIAEARAEAVVLAWGVQRDLVPVDTDRMADIAAGIEATPRAVVAILRMGIMVQWVQMRGGPRATFRYTMPDGTPYSVELGRGGDRAFVTVFAPPVDRTKRTQWVFPTPRADATDSAIRGL